MYKSVNYHTGGIVTTKILRSSKRSTKSSAEQIPSLHPAEDGLVPKPEEDETSPGEHSFIYSPSRRRTRGKPSVHLRTFCRPQWGFKPLLRCVSISQSSRVSWATRGVCCSGHPQQEKSHQRCLCCSSCKKLFVCLRRIFLGHIIT